MILAKRAADRHRMRLRILSTLIALAIGTGACAAASGDRARAFYVNPEQGSDEGSGTLEEPFRSLERVLQTVSDRVDSGIRSDTIYLRGGVYRKESAETLWILNLHGTPDAYAVLSAMPAEPGAEDAVQRQSGRWYERAVFDDGQPITTPWTPVEGRPAVWRTNPGFTNLEWTHQNVWPWTRWENEPFVTTPDDDTPQTTTFTIAPYMVLQEGQPYLWVDDVEEVSGPGMRTYDHDTGVLYVRPFGDVDPNTVEIETWYGGPEPYREGILYLDGAGRAILDGDMRYAELRGFEFRMFARLMPFYRLGYDREEEKGIQRDVRVEDNEFRYGWTHFLLDSNVVNREDPEGAPFVPRYDERSNWEVRNNVFYRPSREVFQVHGDDHLFEHNLVIDHNGPWAGPAAVVGALNARNMRNFTMRYNVFEGQANVRGNRGSIFMVEVGAGSHADEQGDYIFGGLTVENNLFLNVTGGPALVLGKGGTRMRDITVRNNVFDTNLSGPAIRISSPHDNLVIENNVFRRQSHVVQVHAPEPVNPMTSPPLPSNISVTGNIFVENGGTIDPALFEAVEGSAMRVEGNLFYENDGAVIGTDPILGDPLFRAPDQLDYRLQPGSPAIQEGIDAGPYESDAEPEPGVRWWEIMDEAPRSIPPGNFGRDTDARRLVSAPYLWRSRYSTMAAESRPPFARESPTRRGRLPDLRSRWLR